MDSRAIFYACVIATLLVGSAPAQPMAGDATLDRILPEIRAQHPGRLSDATELTGSNGRTYYRIKWITPDGRILFLEADASTGHHKEVHGESWER